MEHASITQDPTSVTAITVGLAKTVLKVHVNMFCFVRILDIRSTFMHLMYMYTLFSMY